MLPIIVIGTGLAGYSLVRELRKLNSESAILMISQDDGHSYSKPMLSTGFTKGKNADDLSMADPGKMAAQLKVSIRNHTQVTSIDTVKKQVIIGTEKLGYSKLVIASGAKVNKLSFPGSEHPSVLSINDLMDYRAFRDLVEGKKHILIMGAGLIGCEYANDLLNGGFNVSIVDPSSSALSGLIPSLAGDALISGLKSAGAGFHMQSHVASITEMSSGQLQATLNDGSEIICDSIISAIGLRPDISLAQTAGLACNQGIITNGFLRTSDPDIYSLGDCAEIKGIVRLYVLPLMASARALARTLSGDETEVSFNVMPIATKTPACSVVVCPPTTSEGQWKFEQDGINIVGKFMGPDQKMIGFVLTGDKISDKQSLIKEFNA
jgi:rubredoxin-NAD+ reductase